MLNICCIGYPLRDKALQTPRDAEGKRRVVSNVRVNRGAGGEIWVRLNRFLQKPLFSTVSPRRRDYRRTVLSGRDCVMLLINGKFRFAIKFLCCAKRYPTVVVSRDFVDEDQVNRLQTRWRGGGVLASANRGNYNLGIMTGWYARRRLLYIAPGCLMAQMAFLWHRRRSGVVQPLM